MTAPVKTPTQLAQEENSRLRSQRGAWDTPYYEQEAKKTEERFNRAQTVVATPQTGIPENAWANRLQNTVGMGQTATQGVMGSISTKNQIKAQKEMEAWKAAQETSLAKIQQAYNTQLAGLQSSYQASMNAGLQGVSNSFAGMQQGGGGGGVQFADGTDNQIANWARQAGWSEDLIPTLVQIARAESGGNVNAINSSNRNGSADYGLMQINTVHRGAGYTGEGFFEGGWKDPVRNLTAAKAIYDQAGGWTPWSVFKSGAYKKYTPQISVQALPTQVGGDLVTSPTGQLRSRIVQTAMQVAQAGVPYVWGGNNMWKGVDCSGLVNEVYKSVGLSMPSRYTARMYGTNQLGNSSVSGTKTSINNLQPGDLVVWNSLGHVAIYAGNNQIIEAQQRGKPVLTRSLNARDYQQAFGMAINFK